MSIIEPTFEEAQRAGLEAAALTARAVTLHEEVLARPFPESIQLKARVLSVMPRAILALGAAQRTQQALLDGRMPRAEVIECFRRDGDTLREFCVLLEDVLRVQRSRAAPTS